ncbi:hypothetical protein BGX33_009225 [Mortierella sp. NVP41]|nr:hypothetical protein BGX33_009225 [Mortierella sp. NVP41]
MSFPNVPIAPMSNLTELYIDLDRATEQRRWGFIYHSRKYHLATFSQVCWMIQLSPQLVKLRMGHLELESVWQVWFLIGIIAGMAWLEALSFTISLDTSSSRPDWFTLWLAILQSTLPSLNQFCLDLGYNFSGSSSSDNDGDGVFGGKEMTMERPQRQETVPGLTELDMPRLEDPTVTPSYKRLATEGLLEEEEKDQFALLERLYRQIGSLTESRYLDLRARLTNADGTSGSQWYDENSLPLILSLGDDEAGSVYASNCEVKETVGWPETRWMHDHWPNLRVAEFYLPHKEPAEQFKWLQEQRQIFKLELSVPKSEGPDT